jgi:hypothetical protein
MKKVRKYEEEQKEKLEQSRRKLIDRGFVLDSSDIYPDINMADNSVSYCKRSMPLILPLLMYDTTAVLVPPVSDANFKRKTGLDFSDVEKLIDAQVIQPLVSDPSRYDTKELGFLLERNAPSVLVRGKHVLEIMGLADLLDPAKSVLPLEAMARVPELRARARHHTSRRTESQLTSIIVYDILVNYADLVIFGYKELVDGLLRDYKDPGTFARLLYDYAEILTYPHLFGFGGTVNYSRENLFTEELPPIPKPSEGAASYLEISSEEMEVFLKGINIPIRTVNADTIINFHEDGSAKKLRAAVREFEARAEQMRRGGDVTSVAESAELVKNQMLDASRQLMSPKFRSKVTERENRVDSVLQLGGIALGSAAGAAIALFATTSFGGMLGAAGVGGIGVAATDVVVPGIKKRIKQATFGRTLSPGLSNLWSIRSRK